MVVTVPKKKGSKNTKENKIISTRVKEKTFEQIKKENIQLKALSKEIPVTPDFIEENKKLSQTITKSKKGGPYPTHYKKTRRDEVFNLHFEYGYSARAISDMMKINRNTVNSDVAFWHSKMRKGFDESSYDDWINKQFSRFESQRVKLRKELDSDITLKERLQINGMIIDLDSKILNLIIKLETSKQSVDDSAVKYINNFMEEHNYQERTLLYRTIVTIPLRKQKALNNILESP